LIPCFFVYCLFVCLLCSIFTRLSQESDGDAIFWTIPHRLGELPFTSFPVVSMTSSQLIWCLFEAIKRR